MDARGLNRRKEIAQVEPEDYALPRMVPREAGDRPAASVAVGGIVRWDVVENFVENATLDCLKALFRHLQQPLFAARFWQPAVGVVLQFLGRLGQTALAVREPIQFAWRDAKPFRQRARRRKLRHGPRRWSHRRPLADIDAPGGHGGS